MLASCLSRRDRRNSRSRRLRRWTGKRCANPPELIVLDWMMPGGSGIQFPSSSKQDEMTRQIPVVMLTARARRRGQGARAPRPVPTTTSPGPSPQELTARLHAVMRQIVSPHLGGRGDRGAGSAGSCFPPGQCRGRSPRHGADRIQVAALLHDPPERVCSREQLLNNVWGVPTCMSRTGRWTCTFAACAGRPSKRRARQIDPDGARGRLPLLDPSLEVWASAASRRRALEPASLLSLRRSLNVATLTPGGDSCANGVSSTALRLGRLVNRSSVLCLLVGHGGAPGSALPLPEAAVGLAVARSAAAVPPHGSGSWSTFFNGI